MVEHERVGGDGVVAPEADLGGELHVAAGGVRLRDAEPGRQVGDPGAGEDRVGVEGDDAGGEVAGAPRRGELPPVRWAR